MVTCALIVDDNELARLLLREFLQALSYAVVAEADTQATALDAYKRHKPDLVILDLALEHDDGLTIFKELKKMNSSVRAVVVSANAQKLVVEELLREGVRGFLAKTFDMKQFKLVIEKALQ